MKILRHIAIAVIITILALSSVSCNSKLIAYKDTLDLKVGDFVDIADYVNGDLSSISVSNSNIVSVISGTVILAEAPGKLTATAIRGFQSVAIDINIAYADTTLDISCSGPLYTTVIGSLLHFTASLGSNCDPNTEIFWYVDGSLQGTGNTFRLSLNQYKKYNVSAKAAGKEASLTAVCYKPFINPPVIQSDCGEVVEAGSEIKFTANCESDVCDIVWYVDGVKTNTQRGNELYYTPSEVGEHNVCAYVNGVKTNEISFIAGGVAEPKNVEIDFDSDYPNVYLKWDGIFDLEYEVKVDEVIQSDKNRFNGNSFDLTGIVDLKKSSSVSIRCLGGEYYTPSDFITIKTPIVPNAALTYLNKKYFDGNYYMSSDQEVFDIISYAIIFRPGVSRSKENNDAKKLTLSLYMGYDSDMSPALLLSRGWSFTEQTGSYKMKASGSSRNGEVIEFQIVFLTVIEPEDDDLTMKPKIQSLMTPHFGTGGLDILPIDSMPSGGSVTSSEQLFYVVQKGYKPEPEKGSAAERIYKKAREIISKIIDSSMSETEKARVIYEWIMWQTIYDQTVLGDSVSEAVRRPAYYLEGVFDNGYAVCDGISKAMSLMCNMVGLPCLRVIGAVEESGRMNSHAWNYVFVEGAWYIVDATWGDGKIAFDSKMYEGGTHYYFLKAEGEMSTHKPTYPELYPKAETYYNWYGLEREYDGGKAPYLIEDTDDDLTSIIKCAAKDLTFTVKVGEEITERDFYCIEIRLAVKVISHLRINRIKVDLAIIGADLRASWIITNDLLLILVKK